VVTPRVRAEAVGRVRLRNHNKGSFDLATPLASDNPRFVVALATPRACGDKSVLSLPATAGRDTGVPMVARRGVAGERLMNLRSMVRPPGGHREDGGPFVQEFRTKPSVDWPDQSIWATPPQEIAMSQKPASPPSTGLEERGARARRGPAPDPARARSQRSRTRGLRRHLLRGDRARSRQRHTRGTSRASGRMAGRGSAGGT
jgi:hypothetical protein